MSLSLADFRQRAMVDAYVPPDGYDGLPDSIKAIVKGYAGCRTRKARLVQDLTEPDPES